MFFTERYLRKKEEELAQIDEDHKDCGPFRLSGFSGPRDHAFDSIEAMAAAVRNLVARADEFYAETGAARDFGIKGTTLRFRSPLADGTANDNVDVDIHSRGNVHDRAVIIIPHWNATPGAYKAIGSVLALTGFAAYVITLPHHGSRAGSGPPKVVNDFLNADLGTAIRSVQQSVCDVRSLISWLTGNGARTIHVIGVSLGSCIASLATAFDPRISSGCLLLTAGDFAETVWRGRATNHIRAAIDGNIDLTQLRQVWAILSPANFVGHFRRNNSRLLIVSGKIDEVVPFDTASRFVNELRAAAAGPDWLVLPCGHYTLSYFPFSWLALTRVVRFLRAG